MTTFTNLNISKDSITFQPFLGIKKSAKNFIALAAITAVVAYVAHWNEEITYSLYIMAGAFIVYAAYDYFIQSKFIIEFNKPKQAVYKKMLGLFTRKLIAFKSIDNIVLIYTNGNPRYCITHKENMFGKYYPVSAYFDDSAVGIAAQDDFEMYVLPILLKVIK